MHSKLKGDIGELIVATELLKSGWNISFPYGENLKYDIISEKAGVMKRIQVKSVFPKDGVLQINCRSSNNWSVRSYSAKDFEVLVAVDLRSQKVYFIPVNKIRKRQFNIRIKSTKNGQKKNINFADNFQNMPS